MSYKFPYFEDRPHIPISIESEFGKRRFLPLLDSGADFSVFYKRDAVRLGLKWTEGKSIDLLNADGSSFAAKEFYLKVNIEGKAIKTKICFIDSPNIGIPLLGRQNIFEQFKISIQEKERFVEFEVN